MSIDVISSIGRPVPSSGANGFDCILNDLVGVSIQVLFMSPDGSETEVVGVNRGNCLEGIDGVVYPYSRYRVLDIC